MEMPHGFSKNGIVCLLLKTLYGLCQSPREWYKTVATLLLRMALGRVKRTVRSLYTRTV